MGRTLQYEFSYAKGVLAMPLDIKSFPQSPGVYLMKDKKGAILYIGKAKNLKKRVAQYFGREACTRYQIKFLMERVAAIEYVQTETEKEAILLEFKFIQEHLPKYNIDLKDNKTFMRIKITTNHAFPGICVTRRVKDDGATYFGPYVSAQICRDVVDQLAKFFRIRTCSDREFLNRSRPSIQYDIGRCTAPCVGQVSKEEYAEQVRDAILFLKGRNRELIDHLRERMKRASEKTNYEAAARLRDLIKGIKGMLEKQNVMSPDERMFERDGTRPSSEDKLYNLIAQRLKTKLHLKSRPHLIECVDISNIQGTVANGAIVSFLDGAPSKSRYRLFNITREEAPNDYAMMAEVLERRFKHEEWQRPDVLMVDGGRGQLSIACKILRDLDINDVSAIGIAKVKGSHKKSSDMAQVFLPNRVNPLRFKRGEAALLYLIRIRDEAHRFAIKHYRKRHSKKLLTT